MKEQKTPDAQHFRYFGTEIEELKSQLYQSREDIYPSIPPDPGWKMSEYCQEQLPSPWPNNGNLHRVSGWLWAAGIPRLEAIVVLVLFFIFALWAGGIWVITTILANHFGHSLGRFCAWVVFIILLVAGSFALRFLADIAFPVCAFIIAKRTAAKMERSKTL